LRHGAGACRADDHEPRFDAGLAVRHGPTTQTLAFSAMAKARPMIREYPLERAAEACERMMSGGARFRVVLKMDGSTAGRR